MPANASSQTGTGKEKARSLPGFPNAYAPPDRFRAIRLWDYHPKHGKSQAAGLLISSDK
jgi:hypothetical protein